MAAGYCLTALGGVQGLAAQPAPAAAGEKTVQEELCQSEEFWLESEEGPVYGVLYLPMEVQETYPTVIISHGFGSTADVTGPVAKYLAEHGFAAYAFDFIGGSAASRSGAADGDMSHMSVLTESAQLSEVIDQIAGQEWAEPENLFLVGQSQGGYVSAYTAAQRPEDIKAMVLEFPAFALQDDCWERHGSIENVPETERFMGQELGAVYSLDAMSMDIYDVIGAYTGEVLLLHGDNDRLVDISYSEKALEVYENAELLVYEGANHGFAGDYADQANADILAFLEERIG
ncbi:MAG: alpha/beta fold hydrolase [Parasporobacterium sp.]|nr:alpha/beta fold hydrolase [Parasporobacterium sp.]